MKENRKRKKDERKLSPLPTILTLLSGVQYEVHIWYQPDVKAKLDIAHFEHNWFSGWFIPNNGHIIMYHIEEYKRP